MVVVPPGATPVARPVPTPIVATDVVPLAHVPPVGEPVNVVVVPAQMLVLPPVIVGVAFTVAIAVTVHPVPNEYVIVVVPEATPPNTPVVASIVPTSGIALDQLPPVLEFVSVLVWPEHTFSVPPIAPGNVFTVTTTVDAQPVAPTV